MASQLSTAPSERSLLKEKAYVEIKARIQDGTFTVGCVLSERKLATLLEMSKTPIKAAMERLTLEGFVTVAPQQGIVVRDLSIREISDQFELRKALECFVVSSISGQLNEKQLNTVQRNLRQQAAAASKQSIARFVELDAEFHMLLCQVLGNAAIVDCMSQHRSKMHRVIYQVTSQSRGRLAEAVNEHQHIFAAIQRGNTDEAVHLVEKHLEFGKQSLLNSGWK